jgi:hypothetical protein
MPLFTNSDWDLIDKRERSDFQYKEILIPFKCPDIIHFLLPAGETYSCDLLPTLVCTVVAKSGLFDKYLENTKGMETADNIDAINEEMHNGLDDRDDDDSVEGPDMSNKKDYKEAHELLVEEQDEIDPDLDDEEREVMAKWNCRVATEYTTKISEHLQIQKTETLTEKSVHLKDGKSSQQRGTRVAIEELCQANIFVASASAIRYKKGHNCFVTKTVKEKVVHTQPH